MAITTLAGVIFSFLKWILPYYKEEKAKKQNSEQQAVFDQGLKAILQVSQLMDELKHHSKITRVLLLEISNGGDMPVPGSKIYATAVSAKIDDEDGRTNKPAELKALNSYNRLMVDDQYIRMLVNAQKDGLFRFVVEEQNDCILKDIYSAENILYSEIYHIYTDGIAKKMFILSVATTCKDHDQFNQTPLRALINTAINGIRSNFQQSRIQVK